MLAWYIWCQVSGKSSGVEVFVWESVSGGEVGECWEGVGGKEGEASCGVESGEGGVGGRGLCLGCVVAMGGGDGCMGWDGRCDGGMGMGNVGGDV
ncbi:hypothetical protein Tco_0821430 [Tanacetum coccineum]|uniref:Uncharacterized protein n=1 Tax=Tanacetum coccineum TaxID=301880 RepID=A0ABQ5AC76_9ASTR